MPTFSATLRRRTRFLKGDTMIGLDWTPPAETYKEDLILQYAAWGVRSTNRQRLLSDTVRTLSITEDVDAPREVCRLLADVNGVIYAGVWGVQPGTTDLHHLAEQRAASPPACSPAFEPCLAAQETIIHRRPYSRAVGTLHLLGVPVWANAQVIGAVSVGLDAQTPNCVDSALLEDIAATVALRWGAAAPGRVGHTMPHARSGPFSAFADVQAAANEPDAAFSALAFRIVNMRTLQEQHGHGLALATLGTLREALTSIMPTTVWHSSGGDEVVGVVAEKVARESDRLSDLLMAVIAAPGLEGADLAVGVASYPTDSRDPAALLKLAGDAISDARVPSGSVLRVDPERSREDRSSSALLRELQGAVKRREIEAHFQPIIDVESGTVVGAEALARWHSQQFGHVSPAVFIPAAQRTNMLGGIFGEIMRQAGNVLSTCAELGHDFRLSINAAPSQVETAQARECLIGLLKCIEPWQQSLAIEITEQALINDYAEADETIARLRGMGIKIYVDDFGTGYSSLAHIHRMPVDCIKIDRTFVQDLTSSPMAVKVTRNIIGLAKDIGADVIAEGVERREQLDILYGLGCHKFQGFMFSPPVVAGEFFAFGCDFNLGRYGL